MHTLYGRNNRPLRLSPIADGIAGALWWYAYGDQVRATPHTFTMPSPLAQSWRSFPGLGELKTSEEFGADINATAEHLRQAAWPKATVFHLATGSPDALARNIGAVEPPEGIEGDDGAWPNEPAYVPEPNRGFDPFPNANPDATPGTAEELASHVKRADNGDEYVEPAKRKPKRIRVRSKPLTDADIVPGGEYVPKRGNNKTPNYYVTLIERWDGASTVFCRRTNDPPVFSRGIVMADFLALVARRVGA